MIFLHGVFLSWEDGISRERLLELRIQQLGRLPEDIEVALEKMKAARLGNKERFDKTHQKSTLCKKLCLFLL